MTPAQREEVKAALGAGRWLEAPTDVAPYLTDLRHLYRGRSPLVARPDSTAAVARLMTVAHRQLLPVVPHGGNTGYCGGATPDESGEQIVLSLAAMNRIRDTDPAGFTLTAEAGCTLAAVQAAAAACRRLFPLSLGSEGSCQIGGNLATNAGGTSVLRYGMMRELTLGLEVVLPDGRVLDQLRGLRKDNTGYDVKQLFIGAEGTLGVITAACLKLFPEVGATVTALVSVADIATAVALLGRMREEFGDTLYTFEYLPAPALALAAHHLPDAPRPFRAPYPSCVLVEVGAAHGGTDLEARFETLFARLAADGLVGDALVAQSGRERDAFWFLREHIPEAQTRAGASLKHDVSLPIAALAAFVAEAESRLAVLAPGAQLIAYGHVGDGNLHFNLSPVQGTADAALTALTEPVKRLVHDLVAAHGGSFSAEHGIGRLKVGELERYEDPVALDVMRRLKAALDPHGIMNPGKVLGAAARR